MPAHVAASRQDLGGNLAAAVQAQVQAAAVQAQVQAAVHLILQLLLIL